MRCPKCGTLVEVAAGQRPVCTSCGHGSRQDASAPGRPGASPLVNARMAPTAAPGPAPDDAGPSPELAAAMPPRKPPVQFTRFESPIPPTASGKVRPTFAGKARPVWLVLLLGILTGGLYLLYYDWAVFRELDHQQRKPHQARYYLWALGLAVLAGIGTTACAVLGLPALVAYVVGGFLSFAALVAWVVYLAREFPQLRAYRLQHGLPPSLGAVAFVLLHLVPLGFLVAHGLLAWSANQLWDRLHAERAPQTFRPNPKA